MRKNENLCFDMDVQALEFLCRMGIDETNKTCATLYALLRQFQLHPNTSPAAHSIACIILVRKSYSHKTTHPNVQLERLFITRKPHRHAQTRPHCQRTQTAMVLSHFLKCSQFIITFVPALLRFLSPSSKMSPILLAPPPYTRFHDGDDDPSSVPS